jgi:hypothetical protein
MSAWTKMEAERAFTRIARSRRRAALASWLRRGRSLCTLAVFDATTGSSARGGVRDIPLEAIKGTTEPNRAAHFDFEFRPAKLTRGRWLSVWVANHRGTALPPISVVSIGGGYAIRDGHHRVSVAKARGVPTIRAVVA